MRPTIELLRILRNELPYTIKYEGSMCFVAKFLYETEKITDGEKRKLLEFLYLNATEKVKSKLFWFPPGKLKPRMEWLNEQIEKL